MRMSVPDDSTEHARRSPRAHVLCPRARIGLLPLPRPATTPQRACRWGAAGAPAMGSAVRAGRKCVAARTTRSTVLARAAAARALGPLPMSSVIPVARIARPNRLSGLRRLPRCSRFAGSHIRSEYVGRPKSTWRAPCGYAPSPSCGWRSRARATGGRGRAHDRRRPRRGHFYRRVSRNG
jgi:hypothetical protein